MQQYIFGILIGLPHGILLGLYIAQKNANHPPAGKKHKWKNDTDDHHTAHNQIQKQP